VTVALVGIASALAMLVAVLVVLLVGRRSRKPGEDKLALAMAEMNERMDTVVRELTSAAARAEEEGRRSRVLGELGGSIDLDEVLSRTLEAAGALPGADAALISMTSSEGKPLVATLGLSPEEQAPAQKQPAVVLAGRLLAVDRRKMTNAECTKE